MQEDAFRLRFGECASYTHVYRQSRAEAGSKHMLYRLYLAHTDRLDTILALT